MSKKLTFSLASLVLLLALGLVFGTAPVIANDGGVVGDANNHPIDGHVDQNGANAAETSTPSHTHPRVSLAAKDDNPNVAGVQVVDKAADTESGRQATFEIDVTLTLPEGALDSQGSDAVIASDISIPNANVISYGPGSLAVGTAEVGTSPGWAQADAAMKPREWTNTITVTVNIEDDADDATTEDAERMAGAAKVLMDGLSVQVTVPSNMIRSGAVIGTMADQGNLAHTATFTIIGEAVSQSVTPVVGKVTGTPSFTDDFEVTFTFDKAVTSFTAANIMITVDGPGTATVVAHSVYADSSAAIANTVWKATIRPQTNPTTKSITVTLTGAGVKAAAATAGKIELIRTSGSLTSITVPEGTNDEAAFVVTLTFASEPTAAPVATDLVVTPKDVAATATTALVKGAEIVGNVVEVLGSNGTMWQVEIKPVKGKATTVGLTDAAKVKYGSAATALTVKVKGAVVTVPTVIAKADATYDSTKEETTLKGMLAAGGFAVVVAEDLPDIQRFYAEGGSISVLSSLTGAVAKDVVISEIMWGLNLRAIGAARSAHQFVELYNTTGAAIDLKDVKLLFDDANTATVAPTGMVLLDQVSNVDGIGWVITAAPGSSGRIAVPDDVTTFVPSDLVSMWRKIDYAKVEKTHKADDAVENRKAQLKDFPNGNAIGSWAASNASDTYGVNLIGSPGAKHFVAYGILTSSPIDRSLVIINEIGNHGDEKYDWVELRNVSSGEVNLKKWELSLVTKDKKDTQLVSFPDNDNHKIGAGDVLLLVNSDPYRDPSHPIAAGTRINGAKAETTGLKGESRYYVDGGLKLANTDDTLLILRSANDKEGKPEAFKDVVGTLSIVDNAASLRTKLWPLRATNAPHANVVDGDKDNKQDDFRSGIVYRRGDASGGTGEKDLARVGYTGVGYKRSAAKSNQNGGTPGYPNGAVIDTDALADAASVTISEVMYTRGRNLPQWIELYNSSTTQAVNLNEWKLKFENADDVDIRTSVTTNNLGGTIIPPNQTVLIVSSTTGRVSRAAQGGIDFPASRVIDMWGQKDKLEVATGLTRRTYSLLSQTAFKITLIAKGGAAADVVGNLGADGTAMWALPMLDPEEGEGRSSIIRRYDEGEARPGTMAPPGDGTGAWVLASASSLSEVRFNETYYGSPDDVGTPGYHGGGALPVSLSKFRPERLDSGEIVVRWITESELNNAGFNILRSEKRDGEFTQLNTKLIAGQGTTSERTVYEFPDTSAKPNVVYYYQIQDVSLDGKVQTLRQSRLKGYVSPAGKLTVTWGELKTLRE